MTERQVYLNVLRDKIQRMKPRTALYIALKEELSALGRWRNKPRGIAVARKNGL